MQPNDRQVGGDHYKKAKIQHWDVLPLLGFGQEYYLAAASKYVSRWRDKDGLLGIEKADHYLEKVIALLDGGTFSFNAIPSYMAIQKPHAIEEFCKAYQLSEIESLFMQLCIAPKNKLDIIRARKILETVIEQAKAELAARARGGELPETNTYPGYTFEAYVEEDAAWQCRKCSAHFRCEVHEAPDCPKCHGEGLPA